MEATHLPTSCPLLPLSWGRRQVNYSGTVSSGGNKAEAQVWVGVRNKPVLRVRRDRCTDLFVQPPDRAPPERGEKNCRHRKGPREPVGSRLIVPRGASETGFSWTRGPPVGGPELRLPLPAQGPPTRVGRAGDLPSRGEMRVQLGKALSGRSSRSVQRKKDRELRQPCPTGPAMAAQGGATARRHHSRLWLGLCFSVATFG